MILEILECDTGKRIAKGSFSKYGILFLVSKDGKLFLDNSVSNGTIAHALFFRRRFKTFMTAISGDIDENDKVRNINRSSNFFIGVREHTVRHIPRYNLRSIFLSSVICVFLCISAITAAYYWQFNNISNVNNKRQTSIDKPNLDVVNLIAEAKRYAKNGNFQQARMSLIEASGIDSNNPRYRKLLNQLDKISKNPIHNDNDKNEKIILAIHNLYNDAKLQIKRGNLKMAYADLRRAVTSMGDATSAFPNGKMIMTMYHRVYKRRKDELKRTIKKTRLKLNNAFKKDKNPLDTLKIAYSIALKSINEMPDLSDAIAFKKNVEGMINFEAKNRMERAKELEALSGCHATVNAYGKIADDFKKLNPNISTHAKKLMQRCTASSNQQL